jgi:uncharacterized protein (DUF608 family)
MPHRGFNDWYRGRHLERIAFPLGGIGAGTVCIEGCGALSHVSLRHQPQVFNEPLMFASVWVRGHGARLIEGPVPTWKTTFPWGPEPAGSAGNGGTGKSYGLPRFKHAILEARFPFARLQLENKGYPVRAEVVAFSPFSPGNADDSSLPCAVLEYRLQNAGANRLHAAFGFHASNFMTVNHGGGSVLSAERGFVLHEDPAPGRPWTAGDFCVSLPMENATSNCRWFRGRGFDPLTMLWNDVEAGCIRQESTVTDGLPSPGGSVQTSLVIEPDEERTVLVLLCWYVPESSLRYTEPRNDDSPPGKSGRCAKGACSDACGDVAEFERYRPW